MYLVSLHGQATSASPSASGSPTECSAGTHWTSSPISSILREHVGAHAGHHAHRDGDVRRVGELHAEHRLLGVEVTHDEGDDVHRAALHAAGVEPAHDVLHLVGVHPVVGGPAVLLVDRADVGAVLDARHVGGVGGCVEGVGLDLGVEPGERAGALESPGELLPLLVGAGAPVDVVGLGELGDLGDPGQDSLVGRRCRRVGGGGHACGFPLAHSRWSPSLGAVPRPSSASTVVSWSVVSDPSGIVAATVAPRLTSALRRHIGSIHAVRRRSLGARPHTGASGWMLRVSLRRCARRSSRRRRPWAASWRPPGRRT